MWSDWIVEVKGQCSIIPGKEEKWSTLNEDYQSQQAADGLQHLPAVGHLEAT